MVLWCVPTHMGRPCWLNVWWISAAAAVMVNCSINPQPEPPGGDQGYNPGEHETGGAASDAMGGGYNVSTGGAMMNHGTGGAPHTSTFGWVGGSSNQSTSTQAANSGGLASGAGGAAATGGGTGSAISSSGGATFATGGGLGATGGRQGTGGAKATGGARATGGSYSTHASGGSSIDIATGGVFGAGGALTSGGTAAAGTNALDSGIDAGDAGQCADASAGIFSGGCIY